MMTGGSVEAVSGAEGVVVMPCQIRGWPVGGLGWRGQLRLTMYPACAINDEDGMEGRESSRYRERAT